MDLVSAPERVRVPGSRGPWGGPRPLARIARLAGLRWGRALLGTFVSRPRRDEIRRVLVIRPDHIGDVLMATPSLRLLRQALPEAEITALVGPWAVRVLAGNPNVDRVLLLLSPGFVRAEPARTGSVGLLRYLRPYTTLLL